MKIINILKKLALITDTKISTSNFGKLGIFISVITKSKLIFLITLIPANMLITIIPKAIAKFFI